MQSSQHGSCVSTLFYFIFLRKNIVFLAFTILSFEESDVESDKVTVTSSWCVTEAAKSQMRLAHS